MDFKKWIFKAEELINTPSRNRLTEEQEVAYRQFAASLISDLGQSLQVNPLCIFTAIVYMHRFYMYHTTEHYPREQIAACCLFLAAKVEEQPRKLEHILKISHKIANKSNPEKADLVIHSDLYKKKHDELVANENLLLQTLGFQITVDHPHNYIVKACQMMKAHSDLAHIAYFLATNCLHLAMICLKYKPSYIACMCIHLACKWSGIEFPRSNEGKDWFYYTDKEVTVAILEEICKDFFDAINKCPPRLKMKIEARKAQLKNLKEVARKGGSLSKGSVSANTSSTKNVPPSHSAATSSQPPAAAPPSDKHNPASKPSVSSTPVHHNSSVDPTKRIRSETALTTKQYMDRRKQQQAESMAKDHVDAHAKSKPSQPSISSRPSSSKPSASIDRHRSQKRPHSSSQPQPSQHQSKHSNGGPNAKHPHLSSHPAKDPHISSQPIMKETHGSSLYQNKERSSHEPSNRQPNPHETHKPHNHSKDLNSHAPPMKPEHNNFHDNHKERTAQPPTHPAPHPSKERTSKEFKPHSKNAHHQKSSSRTSTDNISSNAPTNIPVAPPTNKLTMHVSQPFSQPNSQTNVTNSSNSAHKIPDKVTSPVDPFQHIVDSSRIASVRTSLPPNNINVIPLQTNNNNSNNNNAIKEKLASPPVSTQVQYNHPAPPPPAPPSVPIATTTATPTATSTTSSSVTATSTDVAQQFAQLPFIAHNETPVHAMIKPRHNKPYKPRSHPYNRPNRQSQVTHEIEGHVTTHHGNVTISHTDDVTMKPISQPIISADRDTSSIRSILTTSVLQSRPTPISAPPPVSISSLPSTVEQLDQVDMELDNDSDISVNGTTSPAKINSPVNPPPPPPPAAAAVPTAPVTKRSSDIAPHSINKQLPHKKNIPPATNVVAPLIVKTSHINGDVHPTPPQPPSHVVHAASQPIKLKLKIGTTKVAESVVVLGDHIRNSAAAAKEEKKPATALKLVISKDRSSGNYSSGKKHKHHKSHKHHKHHKHKKSKKKSEHSGEEG